MTFNRSMVMQVPVEYLETCNRLMEAIGRGPNTFSVPAADTETSKVVSYWCHTFDDALALAFDEWAIPTPNDLDKYGFTEESALDALTHIRYRAVEGADAYHNFIECMQSEGVRPYDGTEAEPEPEKGLLSRIGAAIMSFFAPTDLEGQI